MADEKPTILYTIGHSNHKIEDFLQLLKKHEINCIADIRSSPYSRYNVQFNREIISNELKKSDIEYVYLGDQLGARPSGEEFYDGNSVNFEYLSKTVQFHTGLEHVAEIASKYRVALMCAEKDPICCHRFILVCRNLKSFDFQIKHILSDGSVENNSDTEHRMVKMLKIEPTLFKPTSQDELIEQAYEQQASNISYDYSKQEEIPHTLIY
jgi:uncharacterized protein (DUF488 family)